MAILECKDLTKYYDRALGLDHLSLRLEPGRIVGLLGPNGSGKTTLLQIANGLLTPSSGQLLIAGKAPGPIPQTPCRIAQFRFTHPRRKQEAPPRGRAERWGMQISHRSMKGMYAAKQEAPGPCGTGASFTSGPQALGGSLCQARLTS